MSTPSLKSTKTKSKHIKRKRSRSRSQSKSESSSSLTDDSEASGSRDVGHELNLGSCSTTMFELFLTGCSKRDHAPDYRRGYNVMLNVWCDDTIIHRLKRYTSKRPQFEWKPFKLVWTEKGDKTWVHDLLSKNEKQYPDNTVVIVAPDRIGSFPMEQTMMEIFEHPHFREAMAHGRYHLNGEDQPQETSECHACGRDRCPFCGKQRGDL